MNYLLYFLIAIFATTAGSMTGMGGGVIIKPLLDILGNYDVQTIGILSSITVFSMSLVSIGKQYYQKANVPYKIAVPLAFGSAAGGLIGQKLMEAAVLWLNTGGMVTIIQNLILSLLIILVIIYMIKKDHIPTFKMEGISPSIGVGLLLGIFSSFLGIGGGPINVAAIIIIFSIDTKSAAVCSILTILFSQAAKLLMVAMSTGFAKYDLSILPVMIIGAISGGFIGAGFNMHLSERTVERYFNLIQTIVLAFALINMFK